MRLERVIARDSRRATEQVIEQFGADALIISNQKVNGMTEIVVAVDIDSMPPGEPDGDSATIRPCVEEPAGAGAPVAAIRPTTRSEERIEPVLSPLPTADSRREPGFEPWNSAESFGKVLRHSLAPARDDARSPSAQDARKPPSSSTQPATPNARPSLPGWLNARASQQDDAKSQLVPEESPTAARADGDPMDGMRARELVELVRDELASMRREMALSRQMVSSAGARRVAMEIQPLADALEQSGMPVALRSLLIDQIAECSDIREALQTIRKILATSIRILPERKSFTGLHVIAGPSGSGKTHMACRLAARHAASRGAATVAVISFADQRIGAWTQLQMLASRPGVDCFRVGDTSVLSALLGELSSRELILIDTAAAAWRDGLDAIHDCAPNARFNLLMPADASAGSIQRFAAARPWDWHSLMISKMDEALQPWPLIQSLCNQAFALSVASADPAIDSLPREVEPGELADHALAQCPELNALVAPEPLRARKPTPRKSTRELRNAA